MIITEKQIMHLLNQLRDHIELYDRLSILGVMNQDYLNWLREPRDEIIDRQSDEPKDIK